MIRLKSVKITDQNGHLDNILLAMNEPCCFMLEELKEVKIIRRYAME